MTKWWYCYDAVIGGNTIEYIIDGQGASDIPTNIWTFEKFRKIKKKYELTDIIISLIGIFIRYPIHIWWRWKRYKKTKDCIPKC